MKSELVEYVYELIQNLTLKEVDLILAGKSEDIEKATMAAHKRMMAGKSK